MEQRPLGRTGLRVSVLCLGTMTFGNQNTEAEGHAQMDYALAEGINFFDTAELYAVPPSAETCGKTESIVGTWFAARKNRDKVILATKVAGAGLPWIRGGQDGIDRRNVLEAVEGSLRRLQTDYIDLYQLHWPNRSTYHFESRWSYTPANIDRARGRKFSGGAANAGRTGPRGENPACGPVQRNGLGHGEMAGSGGKTSPSPDGQHPERI